MKIRVISDIHLDVNQKFPFSLKNDEKDVFTLIAGDISGNVKLTAKWVKNNINRGMFVVGNHDPCYNNIGKTIQDQKMFLHEKFPIDNDVTFLDEQVGVMSKEIPETNILVIGSTLYTDYKYISEYNRKWFDSNNKRLVEEGEKPYTVEYSNMASAHRRLNDFRWGHVQDEIEPLKQRYVKPEDYLKWFNVTFKKIKEIVEANPDKEIIVLTHHCPSFKCISSEYVTNHLNASYFSDLEGFIKEHKNIKAWCCGHVHSVTTTDIDGALLMCNPRGYERNFESTDWNPNTFIDTDTWTVSSYPYKNKRLEDARKKAHDEFMKYAPFFF